MENKGTPKKARNTKRGANSGEDLANVKTSLEAKSDFCWSWPSFGRCHLFAADAGNCLEVDRENGGTPKDAKRSQQVPVRQRNMAHTASSTASFVSMASRTRLRELEAKSGDSNAPGGNMILSHLLLVSQDWQVGSFCRVP